MPGKYIIECDEATYNNIIKLLQQQEQNRIRARERQRKLRGSVVTDKPTEIFFGVYKIDEQKVI